MKEFYHPYCNVLPWSNRLRRLAWGWVQALLFRPTPVCLFRWRAWLVRRFGGQVHPSVRIYPSARIWAPWNLVMAEASTLAEGVDCYSVDRIEIGAEVTVSQRAFLCTASHDLEDPQRRLTTKPIRLGQASWVFAEAFVAPGVTVGEGAVVAARAVVVKDVAPWTVVGGNPAQMMKRRIMRSRGQGSDQNS